MSGNAEQYIVIPSPIQRGVMDFKPRLNKKMNIMIDCMTSVEIDVNEMIAHFTHMDANGIQIKVIKNLLKYDVSIIEIAEDFEYLQQMS